jgi:hypothetical protein
VKLAGACNIAMKVPKSGFQVPLAKEHDTSEAFVRHRGDALRDRPDLEGVTLVDIEVVRFLNACEKSGVELLHCWPYIREWTIRENAREG